ncbi:MAG TPA: DHHA1 domain-containing protein, partial [Armatimonadota bacterium]|nr:DHHA1 domain-containing protein [Armatimonadota bacterium]
ELLTYRVAEMAASAERLANGWRVVCRVLEGMDAAAMRLAANTLIAEPGLVAILAVTEPAPQVVLARSADVELGMGALLREVLAAHGGRGGGAAHLAQGGAVRAEDLPAILAEARRRLLAE